MKIYLFILFCVSFGTLDACRCIPLSMLPPEDGCPDKFLAIVNITNVELSQFGKNYGFKVIADYTNKLKNHKQLSDFKGIFTRGNEAACGVTLRENNLYLLMGHLEKSIPTISLCGSIITNLPKEPNNQQAKEMLDKTYKDRCVVKKNE